MAQVAPPAPGRTDRTYGRIRTSAPPGEPASRDPGTALGSVERTGPACAPWAPDRYWGVARRPPDEPVPLPVLRLPTSSALTQAAPGALRGLVVALVLLLNLAAGARSATAAPPLGAPPGSYGAGGAGGCTLLATPDVEPCCCAPAAADAPGDACCVGPVEPACGCATRPVPPLPDQGDGPAGLVPAAGDQRTVLLADLARSAATPATPDLDTDPAPSLAPPPARTDAPARTADRLGQRATRLRLAFLATLLR